MDFTRRKKLLERFAEGLLVVVILAVTGATWLPALIGADPDATARIAREQAALKREQELRRARGSGAAPAITGRPSPAPRVPAGTPAR